jgi:hypothetical protein
MQWKLMITCVRVRISSHYLLRETSFQANFIEWGIYCELNQVNAITYPVPMGASDGDLVQLREALHDVGQKLRTSHSNITQWRIPNSNTNYPIELPLNNQFSTLPQESELDGRRMKIVSLSKIHLLEGATAAETVRIAYYILCWKLCHCQPPLVSS